MNTAVEIAGVKFKNPVITASGTFGFGKEYNELYPVSALGGICTKGLTIKEREGNASPRVAETPSGMLNSVGLQNPGVEYYLKEYDGWLSGIGTAVIANIAGSKLEDYVAIASRINDSSADMVELNISCPNVRSGGIAFGVQPDSVRRVTEAVKKVCVKPVITKLTPNVSCIADNAKAAEDGGADAISLINTITGMAVDYKRRRPILANNTGGLSGPCVKPIALRMVWVLQRRQDTDYRSRRHYKLYRRVGIHDMRGARCAGGYSQYIRPVCGVYDSSRLGRVLQGKRPRYQYDSRHVAT